MTDKINTPEMLASHMDRSGRGEEASFLTRLTQGVSGLFGGGLKAGNENITIVDMSYWQDHTRINYDLLCENVDAFILRACYGIWKDTRFDIHREEILKRNKPVGAYAYIIGSQSPRAQAETFYNATKSVGISAGLWNDVEDQREVTKLSEPVVDAFMLEIEGLAQVQVDIYTGVWAWFNIMRNGSHKYGDRKLWIANYGVLEPRLPMYSSWDKFWMWQHTEHGRLPGYHSNLDLNRFGGTEQEFRNWVGGIDLPEPPEENDMFFRAKCIVRSLRIRRTPDTSDLSNVVGGLSRNDIVDVFEVSSNGWYRIGVNRWVSGDPQHMKKITEEEDIWRPEPSDKPLTHLFYPCDERWPLSQIFGANPQWYHLSKGHNGIDFAIPVGNPIYAAEDGVVEVARAETYGYGRHIRIRHSHGITIYGHMSRNDVKVGDRVKAKQIIGLSGGAVSDPYSGMSTGPHLHFEYRLDIPVVPLVPGSYRYNAVDPRPLLKSHETEDALFRAKCRVPSLRVRTRPSTDKNALIVGGLVKDQVVNVYEVSPNGWYRIGIERWVSGHEDYMKPLSPIPPHPDPIDEIPEEIPSDPGMRVKIVGGSLTIREEPRLDAPVAGYVVDGNEFKVYEISDNKWYLLDKGWISGNTKFTELIEG